MHGGRKLQTDTHIHTHTHTHTQDNYSSPHYNCVWRVIYGKKVTCIRIAIHTTERREGGKKGAMQGRRKVGKEGGREGGMQCGGEQQGRREGGQESRNVGWWEG